MKIDFLVPNTSVSLLISKADVQPRDTDLPRKKTVNAMDLEVLATVTKNITKILLSQVQLLGTAWKLQLHSLGNKKEVLYFLFCILFTKYYIWHLFLFFDCPAWNFLISFQYKYNTN